MLKSQKFEPKSGSNLCGTILVPSRGKFPNFNLLSSHTRSGIPLKNIMQKGNENQGEKGCTLFSTIIQISFEVNPLIAKR